MQEIIVSLEIFESIINFIYLCGMNFYDALIFISLLIIGLSIYCIPFVFFSRFIVYALDDRIEKSTGVRKLLYRLLLIVAFWLMCIAFIVPILLFADWYANQ